MPRYEYAVVQIRCDAARCWGDVTHVGGGEDGKIAFSSGDIQAERDEAIAGLGEDGFRLHSIVNDPMNHDGVEGERWIFERELPIDRG